MVERETGRADIGWLLDTMDRMVRCQNVAALVDVAYDAIREGLGYDRVGLLLVEPARGALVEHVGTDEQGRKFYPRHRVAALDGDGYYARLLGQPCMRPDGPGYVYLADTVRELPAEMHDRRDGRRGQTLRVALRTGGRVTGVISVDNLVSGRAIRPEDAPPLVAFANVLATAVENARLLEERARHIDDLDASLRQRVVHLTWLQEAASRLAVLHDVESVLDATYACLRDGLRYDRVGVFLFEVDDAGRRVSREVRGTDEQGRPTRGLPGVDLLDDPDLAAHSPDIHHLAQGHPYYYCPDRWGITPTEHRCGLEGQMGEQLAVALRRDDALIGYLSVDNLLSGRGIGEADASPLLAFAAQATLAIDRARLWADNARLLEQERAERARLEVMATTDALTGLPNRTLLHDRLAHALRHARRDGTPLALLLLDLDRFKEVNDTLGHHIGDLLLRQVASRMREPLRASDTVARLGGDEFGILLPATDEAGAIRVARTLLDILGAPFPVEGHALDIGASIGIALTSAGDDDAPALLRHADVAMYTAKRAHGGYALYDAEADQHSPQRLALMGALRQAVAAGELLLYYQPKVMAGTGRLGGVEALLRWPHAEHGFIPPDYFIPLAEHTGLIVPLTEWVLRTALRQHRAWRDRGLLFGMAVNLSARTLHDTHLPDLVRGLLGQHDIAPAQLTLEITESALMVDPARAREVLTRLTALGVRIAIDDFGTGYSSLGYLKRLPVHEVKIDKSLVPGLGAMADPKDIAIVRAVVAMARALGLDVVAEGVERAESLDLLRGLGCTSVQGYYFSRPLPASELERWAGALSPSPHPCHALF